MSNSKEMKGVVIEVFPAKKISEKLTVREFHLKNDDEYPQEFKVQTINSRVSILDNVNAGDLVKIKYNLKGRCVDGKFFTTVEAWAVDVETGAPKKSSESKPAAKTASKPVAASKPAEDDDMPF